jgi:hypothetical protein
MRRTNILECGLGPDSPKSAGRFFCYDQYVLLLLILLILLFGGGGGFYGFTHYGPTGGLGIIVVVILLAFVFRGRFTDV